MKQLCGLILISMAFNSIGRAAAAEPKPPSAKSRPQEIVLVEPSGVTKRSLAQWRREGFSALALVLDESFDKATYEKSGQVIGAARLGLFYWIEVARNPRLATEHPEWMASLGSHEDWQKLFPNVPLPQDGEVAKVFPWAPINYREAFDAQLERVKGLLARAAGDYRGVLLNDLQGGPSSCGCGNVQCRWATDYNVPATGTKLPGDDAAAKFVAAVQRLVGDKQVIPVWTTECADEDLPSDKRAGQWSTGYSGTVGCAVGRCPKELTKQWTALLQAHRGSVGVLALHREFRRVLPQYGGPTAWIVHPVSYLDTIPAQHGGTVLPRDRLWLVVEGHGVPAREARQARRTAARTGAGAIVVARTRIDQSYEPRIVKASARGQAR
jgi:hypothetical protein